MITLVLFLCLCFLQSLLTVHDSVAQKSYDPELPPLPEDMDDDEDSVKIIRLVKNKEPLVSNKTSRTCRFAADTRRFFGFGLAA